MSRVPASVSLTAAAACWGVAAVVSKRAVDEIEPLTLLPIELAISVATLAAVAVLRGQRLRPDTHARPLAALGVLNPGVSYALSLLGLARITASLSVLLWALEPILIIAVAWLALRDRLRTRELVCAVAALSGVVLVVFQPAGGIDLLGVALTVAGVAACAVYSVWSSRYLAESATLSVVVTQQAAALGFASVVFVASRFVTGDVALGDVSVAAWVSAAVAGVLYYGAAFWFYLDGLGRTRPAVAGMFINLVPVFGLAAGRIGLGERLTARQWLGAALVVVALAALAATQLRVERASRSAGVAGQ